ncbi:MAG: hypothetical protein AAF078_01420 [Planctomycetota bacterium]
MAVVSAWCVAAGVALAGCSESASNAPAAAPAHNHGVEVALAPVVVGDTTVELAQGHGALTPGGVGHLAIKLPYSDDGATKIRVWIGAEDPAGTTVADAIYIAQRDYYDVHMTTPDPLAEGAKWWIEVEKPDGTKAVGSSEPRK